MSVGNRDNWATGGALWAVINAVWRPTLDVCASAENTKCGRYYDVSTDALRDGVPWGRLAGDRYFCNAPGSLIERFVEKALREQVLGARGVMIFQAGISTGWFRALSDRAVVMPLSPRPEFVPPVGVSGQGNDRDWMLAVVEPWMAVCRGACGITRPWLWEVVGVGMGVLEKPLKHRRAVVTGTWVAPARKGRKKGEKGSSTEGTEGAQRTQRGEGEEVGSGQDLQDGQDGRVAA